MGSESHVSYIGIGSNMGDRLAYLREALAGIAALSGTTLVRCSRLYQTEPLGYQDQDWFLNAAIQIRTPLDPRRLIQALNRIEALAGRDRHGGVRFGPRTLDLDILLFDDRVIVEPDLEIPHPRLHKRRFVLKPLCDIDPTIVHPVLNKSVGELMAKPDIAGQRIDLFSEGALLPPRG